MGLKSHLERKEKTFDSGEEMAAKAALLELAGVGEKIPQGWKQPRQGGSWLLWGENWEQLIKVSGERKIMED